MPNLAYLDERPVSEIERLTCDAFVKGGIEEELRVKEEYSNGKQKYTRAITESGAKLADEGKIKRKATFKKMMAEVQLERSDLVEKHKELKAKYKELPEGHND